MDLRLRVQPGLQGAFPFKKKDPDCCLESNYTIDSEYRRKKRFFCQHMVKCYEPSGPLLPELIPVSVA